MADPTPLEDYVLSALNLFLQASPPDLFDGLEAAAMQRNPNIDHMKGYNCPLMVIQGHQASLAALNVKNIPDLKASSLIADKMREVAARDPAWTVKLSFTEDPDDVDGYVALDEAEESRWPVNRMLFVGLNVDRVASTATKQ